MISRLGSIALTVAVLAACGKKTQSTTVTTDSAAAPAPAATPAVPAPEPAPPTGISGAPGVARQGVDNANAAAGQRESSVDSLTRQAAGSTTP